MPKANEPSKRHEAKDAPTASSTLNLTWMIRALRKSWHLVLASVFAMGIASVLYTKSLPKVYEAQALIEFVPDVIRPLGGKDDSSRFWGMLIDNREYYETQYNLMTSDLVLSQIVRDLSLQSDAEFVGRKMSEPMALEDAVALLRDRVRVEPLRSSRLVYVRCEDTNPTLAVKICDAVAKGYVRQNRDKQLRGTSEAAEWLSGQLDHFKGELETNENQLHEFKKSNDLPSSSPDEVSKMIRLEMQHYDEALSRTRTRRQELMARQAELSKVSSETPDQLPASELLGNSFLSTLRTQYQAGIRERRELIAEGKGENHQAVRRADEKIAAAKRDLMEEIRNIQGSVARDVSVISRQEGGEVTLYEAARKKAVDLNLKELEYHRIDRQRVQNEKLYGVLLDQLKEADLARMMNVETVRVVDHPVTPKSPIRPKLPANAGVGLALGLLLGIGIAIAREQLDSSIKAPEDVEEHLGLSFLGVFPQVGSTPRKIKGGAKPRRIVSEKLAPELLIHEKPLSPLAESARAVRTNLLFMNPDSPPKVILVSSAAPAEGKTTVACSIAITMAQSGKRVCLVDCDLRRPRLHRIFGRAGDSGVTSVILGEASVKEVALPTIVDNLFCIPSGPLPPNPAEVLHSERFKEFLDMVADHFDQVIIDSPPVAAVADAAVMSTLVDGVVFVVRAFSTARALVQHGLRSLLDVDAPIFGVVLNAVDLEKHHTYYQYYYYKREGYAQRDRGMGRTAEAEPQEPPVSPPSSLN